MRIGSDEWREEMGRAAAGKTIASLAWETDEDGYNGYWLMRFTDGSEVCWSESVAEEEARQEEGIKEERATRRRVESGLPCCEPGFFHGGMAVPRGWSMGTTFGGVLCSWCGAIWRLDVAGQWSKELAPGSGRPPRSASAGGGNIPFVIGALVATTQVASERLTEGWGGGAVGSVIMGGTLRIPTPVERTEEERHGTSAFGAGDPCCWITKEGQAAFGAAGFDPWTGPRAPLRCHGDDSDLRVCNYCHAVFELWQGAWLCISEGLRPSVTFKL